MYTVFVEYRIHPQRWEEYLQLIPHIRRITHNTGNILAHSFLVGSNQQPPNVVEIIQVSDWTAYEQICQQRREQPDELFTKLESCMKADRTNIRIWIFEAVSEPSSS